MRAVVVLSVSYALGLSWQLLLPKKTAGDLLVLVSLFTIMIVSGPIATRLAPDVEPHVAFGLTGGRAQFRPDPGALRHSVERSDLFAWTCDAFHVAGLSY